jgi:hypothetical protein
MGGGIFQLIAYGSQDIYLTGNPQITFFKAVYSRHSNFSIESIEQVFKGTPTFGNKISTNINRNGDLLHSMVLEVEISTDKGTPELVNRPGFALINHVELEIGGQPMDKQYGEWMDIWSQLSHSGEKYGKLEHMINGKLNSNKAGVKKLYIPLQFWFNRNIGLALPLIALQYHEVSINLYLNKEANIRKNHESNNNTFQINNINLFCDYIFLDTDERRRFAQVSHEYLIEQVQFNGKKELDHSITHTDVKLNLNHPCKELVCVVQSNLMVGKQSGGNGINHFPFDFSRPNTADNTLLNLERWPHPSTAGLSYWVNPSSGSASMSEVYDDDVMFLDTWGAVSGVGAAATSGVSTDSLSVSKYQDPIEDLVSDLTLELNGSDRFTTREGTYFRLVQPFQHHTGGFDHQKGQWYWSSTFTPSGGSAVSGPLSNEKGYIYTYSFGINPEQHQPSGTCNFSRIDNSVLKIGLNKPNREVQTIVSDFSSSNNTTVLKARAKITNDPKNHIRVYATNYNVLRITSGMGGLAYSN